MDHTFIAILTFTLTSGGWVKKYDCMGPTYKGFRIGSDNGFHFN